MGYMRHHAIIVTHYHEKELDEFHAKAMSIFPTVSPILKSETNGYGSFFIPPDGSKEGWMRSEEGNKRRSHFVSYLLAREFPPHFVEVQYGDDEGINKICESY